MNSKDYIQWLSENSLLEKTRFNVTLFKRIFKECLGASNENVLIITDNGYDSRRTAPIVAGSYYMAAQELGLKTNLVLQSDKTAVDNAGNNVTDALNEIDEGGIMILCVSNKLGKITKISKTFRGYVRKKNQKFISSTSLGTIHDSNLDVFLRAIDINYDKLQERQAKVKELLDDAEILHVRTKAGTDLEIKIKDKRAVSNDGNYTTPGVGGNIPCGEVYVPPMGKNGVNGKVVIDTSSRNIEGTLLIKEPITLEIEKGRIVDIRDGRAADLLDQSLEDGEKRAKHPENVRLLGEFGIGMNPNARIIGSTLLDEKVMGTAHVAIGSNTWFGGDIKTIVHFDQVFMKPEITLDGKILTVM